MPGVHGCQSDVLVWVIYALLYLPSLVVNNPILPNYCVQVISAKAPDFLEALACQLGIGPALHPVVPVFFGSLAKVLSTFTA